MSMPFGRCYWVEPERVLAGCYPGAPEKHEAVAKLEALLDAGIRTFVNLMEPDEPDHHRKPFVPYDPLVLQLAASRGVEASCLRFPVRDGSVPTPETMSAILSAVEKSLAEQRPVFIHCWGGRGRTGTVVGCWLVRRGLVTADNFVEAIRRLRRADASGGLSPENAQQVEFVRAFAQNAKTCTVPVDWRDRYLGCLLGLATGDALGTTLEFRRPGTFRPIVDMVGGGPFGLKPGQWTDDTSMALCLAESLVERRGFDPGDQMRRYVRWWREGYLSSNGRCFDIGNTVRAALAAFEATGNPYSGSTDPRSAGNGSLMRLAPVSLAYAGNPATAMALAGASSRTTHGAATAVDACRYMAALVVGALKGEPKEMLLSTRYSPCPGYWLEAPLEPNVDAVACGSFKRKEPPEIQGTGYVVDALEAALWAFHRHNSFREGCLAAVNLGEDADTTGAIYGQLAGAYYGMKGIPSEWLDKLAFRDRLEQLADGLLALNPG